MDKSVNGLAGAMREIAEQRDNQLRSAGEIPARRSAKLQAFLAAELPVETGLSAAARRRDESLTLAPELPAAVHATLIQQARSVRAAAKPFGLLRQLVAWLEPVSLPLGYRTAAVVAVAVVLASAALRFFPGRKPAIRISSEALPVSIVNPDPAAFSTVSIFERPADQSTLPAKRFELASLEPSLLTINRALPDFERPDRVLPLDLPIRQIRLDIEAVRTP